jgi:hypothetical protein
MTILNTEASKRLEQYIKDHKDSKTGEKLPLVFRGERNLFDVFRLPIELLTYNVNNGRLKVDVLEYKRQEGKEIDPWSVEGKSFLRERLLSQKDTEELISSLDHEGQVEPGLVTYDGVVINANRRMAAISKLDDECESHKPGKHKFLLAAILPADVTEEELYQIEANLQFGFDYKAKYGPMNELLKIQDGIRFNGPKQLSIILGKDEKEVRRKLRILALIDDYLVKVGCPNQYELIADEETYSHFYELPDLIDKLQSAGKGDDIVEKYLTIGYTMIREEKGHREVRRLKKMCELPAEMENRILELADAENLKKPKNEELGQRIENRIDEGDAYIKQETKANAPLDIVDDLVVRVDLLQPKRNAPYRSALLEKLKILGEKVKEKISLLESPG